MEKFTENTRFCLIGNYLTKIIPALQSRCTRFRFGPLDNDQMEVRLQSVIESEGWVLQGHFPGVKSSRKRLILVNVADLWRRKWVKKQEKISENPPRTFALYQLLREASWKDCRAIVDWLVLTLNTASLLLIIVLTLENYEVGVTNSKTVKYK